MSMDMDKLVTVRMGDLMVALLRAYGHGFIAGVCHPDEDTVPWREDSPEDEAREWFLRWADEMRRARRRKDGSRRIPDTHVRDRIK
jgi:hypothetical protein